LLIFIAAVTAAGVVCGLALRYDVFVGMQGGELFPTNDLTVDAAESALAPQGVAPDVDSASETSTPAWPYDPSGLLLFSAPKGGISLLYGFYPNQITPVQLTDERWNAMDPALSPDGKKLAFVSQRSGQWDLFVRDLVSGSQQQMTDTADFERHPAWSPDGQWLAFDSYDGVNMDIWLFPVGDESDPMRITSHPGMDCSPSWAPGGRQIVFSSDRFGSQDILMMDLDAPLDQFKPLTQTQSKDEMDPVFSPDGTLLAFSQRDDGEDVVFLLDLESVVDAPRRVGNGRFPAWSPDGSALAVVQPGPYHSSIFAFSIKPGGGPLLGLRVSNVIHSLSWHSGPAAELMADAGARPLSSISLYEPALTENVFQDGRLSLVPLEGVSAPEPALSDAVDEAFRALRKHTQAVLGWDFLANLEYAFVGLNDPLPPGYVYNDWLYTGRAFAVSEAIVAAGWIEVVREDFAGQTYWRLYVRSRFQDGSQGAPLRDKPWEFSPRFDGDAVAYDQGGVYKEEIPEGYYVDFTALAQEYGFLRQPALSNWRTYYAGARFAEFALMDGLSWTEAMLELYPPAALVTPTAYCTPTITPTRTPVPTFTPWWQGWQTPTMAPSVTLIPLPSETPAP